MIRSICSTRKRLFNVLSCLALAALVFFSSSLSISAEVTEESIKAKENQISEAKKERDNLSNVKSNLEKIKKDLEASNPILINISRI